MINPKINKEIASLWHEYFDKYELGKTPVSIEEFDNVKAPMFYDEPKQGGILFIGMNPSSGTNGGNKIIKEDFPSIGDLDKYLLWKNIKTNESGIDMMVTFEKEWIKKYPFFKPMRDISLKTGRIFQHVDLFLFRETNQNSFIRRIESKGGILNKFGVDQIMIFHKVLDSLNPEVMVVANAKASQIFRKEYRDELVFDDSMGLHYFKRKIPIFFSGMLTGQRALDNHSRERLDWHVMRSVSGLSK